MRLPPRTPQHAAPRRCDDHDIEQIHAKFSFENGAKCFACGRAPFVRAITMVPFSEAMRRGMLLGLTEQQVSLILVKLRSGADPKGETFVRTSITYACQACAPELERAAAKGPSWAVVDIHRGPNKVRQHSGGGRA